MCKKAASVSALSAFSVPVLSLLILAAISAASAEQPPRTIAGTITDFKNGLLQLRTRQGLLQYRIAKGLAPSFSALRTVAPASRLTMLLSAGPGQRQVIGYAVNSPPATHRRGGLVVSDLAGPQPSPQDLPQDGAAPTDVGPAGSPAAQDQTNLPQYENINPNPLQNQEGQYLGFLLEKSSDSVAIRLLGGLDDARTVRLQPMLIAASHGQPVYDPKILEQIRITPAGQRVLAYWMYDDNGQRLTWLAPAVENNELAPTE